VCVCMYVCMNVFTYVCACVCMYVFTYVCVCACVRVYVSMYVCVMYVWMYVCTMYVGGLMFTLCNTYHRNSMNVDTRFENIKSEESYVPLFLRYCAQIVVLQYSAVHSDCIDVASHQWQESVGPVVFYSYSVIKADPIVIKWRNWQRKEPF